MRYYIIYIMHLVGFINLLVVTGSLYRGRHLWEGAYWRRGLIGEGTYWRGGLI
jgi:hypothetical protein